VVFNAIPCISIADFFKIAPPLPAGSWWELEEMIELAPNGKNRLGEKLSKKLFA